MTKIPWFKAERITEHLTADDLKSNLLASCGAFPFASLVFRQSTGSWYCDGGLSDFQVLIYHLHSNQYF